MNDIVADRSADCLATFRRKNDLLEFAQRQRQA